MTYCTIEATLDKNNIVYDNAFVAPKTKTRVLITFLESTDGLIELNENELTDEFTEGKNRILLKDKSLLSNI